MIPKKLSYIKRNYHSPITNNFLTVFSTGFVLGIDDGAGPLHNATWSASTVGRTALKTFLGGGGPSGPLTADTMDATSVSGGALTHQLAALLLNVSFNDANVLGGSSNVVEKFGDLHITATSTAADGLKVRDVLAQAQLFAAGHSGYSLGLSAGDLQTLVANLNLSFDNGVETTRASAHLIN